MAVFSYCKDKLDCFANNAGKCICLSDTEFHNRECPFYKNAEVLSGERRKSYNELYIRRKTDLLEKYNVPEF